MGIIVHDNVQIPNIGLTVLRADCYLTIDGSYTIRKVEQQGNITYEINTTIQWYETVSSPNPIVYVPYHKVVSELPTNIYSYIYSDISSQYSNVENF